MEDRKILPTEEPFIDQNRDYNQIFSLIQNNYKLFDVQSFGEKLAISLRVRENENSTNTKKYYIWIKDFRPYFFVPYKDVEEKMEFFEYVLSADKVYRIELKHPKEVVNVRQQFKFTYEADILYDLRFHYDILREYPENLLINSRIWYLDIEVFGNYEKSIPQPNELNKFINAIAIYDNYLDKYFSIVVIPKKKKNIKNTSLRQSGILKLEDEKRIIIKVQNEEQLIKIFLHLLNKLKPDIITGWNSMYFDIPFIVERISIKYPELLKFLSPFRVNPRKTFNHQLNSVEYEIVGIVHLDYMLLYKKYGDRLPRYNLETVAQHVLKTGKVQYENSLDWLYEHNFEKFIEYNKVDIQLIKEIEEKAKMINLVETLKNLSTTKLYTFNFSNTVKFGDGILMKYFRKRTEIPYVLRTSPKSQGYTTEILEEKYAGAIVRTPKLGFYEFVIDFDASSMYPSIMRTLNISPETFILQIVEDREFIRNYLRPYLLNFDYDELMKIGDLLTIPLDVNYTPTFNLRDEQKLKWFNEKYKKEIIDKIWNTITSKEFSQQTIKIIRKDKYETLTIEELRELLEKETNSNLKQKIRNFRIAINGAVFRTDKLGVVKMVEDELTNLRKVVKNKRKVAGKLINIYKEQFNV
jgi:DNA polymerase elongation subunit (family B)